MLLNILLSSAVCAVAFLAGLSFHLGGLASFLGAAMLAVAPSRLNVEICNDQEAALIALMAVIAMWCSAEFLALKHPKPAHALGTGIVWGLTILAAPALGLVFACIVAWLLIERRFLGGSLILAAGILVLAPWLIRDRIELGGWIPIRDSLWLELRVSNDDRAVADPSANAESGGMQLYHPLFSLAEARRIEQYGELREYDRLRRDTIRWVEQHPSRFAELTAQRFINFWMPLGTSRIQQLYRLLLYVLAGIGLVFLYGADKQLFALAFLFPIVYPLPYYLTQSYSRYAYPMEWLVTLLAAYAIAELATHFSHRTGPR